MSFWSEVWKFFGGGKARPPVVKPPVIEPALTVHVAVLRPDGKFINVDPVIIAGSMGSDFWSVQGVPLSGYLLSFALPRGVAYGDLASIEIHAEPGYVVLKDRVVLAPDVNVTMQPAAPATPAIAKLHLQGRNGFHTPSGAHVPLTSVTGFKLVHLVASGQLDAARAFLKAIAPARCVRVLVMAKHLFELDPLRGRDALAATLKLAEECGRYLSVVACADTASYDLDIDQHVASIGATCALSPACAFLEIGNELSSLHSTQDDRLGDVDYLKRLRKLIPASVAVSLGSTHADQDESDIFKDGDLLTIHGARDDGDGGWRWVRHTNEQRALGDRVGKHPVNDEPKRDDLAPDRHLGLAILCRMFRISDTFHYGGGLQCLRPSGAELVAFQARARGWAAIPDDWHGAYYNTGFAGSPVKSFDGAVRVYSSVSGASAYSLVLGGTGGLRIDWADDWPHRERVLTEGGCQLWKVTR